jgi:thymidylate kinase
MNIVVLEGIDGSGKSSVIRELRNLYGDDKFHPLFLDRFVYSAFVYEKMRRERDEFIDELIDTHKKFVANFEVKVFYLSVAPSIAISRMQKKVDDFTYTIEEYDKMIKLFDQAFKVFPGNINVIDANKDLEEVVREIWKKLI